MRRVALGNVTVSGLCIGGNPFSGFSHQNEARSREMVEYYTPERIKATLRAAEAAGIDTFFARTDDHMLSIIRSYWDGGGTIQWFAQVSQDKGDPDSWRRWMRESLELGAHGAYLHGGVVDFSWANGHFDTLREALDMMRAGGVAAGFAGHRPEAHAWIRDNLEVDFHMCSHYNPTDRTRHAQHIATGEKWNEEDRERMLETIETIRRPVVHYKVFAGGNKPVVPAFELLGKLMKPDGVVTVGMFLKDDPDMIARNVALFEKHVDRIE
jgi:hypothetical protein